MPGYLVRAGFVIFALFAFITVEAAARRNPSRCLTFESFDPATGTVSIKNRCSQCRRVTIGLCDGSTDHIRVPRLTSKNVPGFPGCTKRKTADYPRERSPRKARRQSLRDAPRRKQHTLSAAASARKRPEPSSLGSQVITGVHEKQASTSAGKGNSPAPASNAMGVPAPLHNSHAYTRTPMQIAVFPEGSEQEWSTLLCTISGQRLH